MILILTGEVVLKVMCLPLGKARPFCVFLLKQDVCRLLLKQTAVSVRLMLVCVCDRKGRDLHRQVDVNIRSDPGAVRHVLSSVFCRKRTNNRCQTNTHRFTDSQTHRLRSVSTISAQKRKASLSLRRQFGINWWNDRSESRCVFM